MNYWHLRAFHTVAAAGSFTRAAAQLHITQPTLSEQVKALEESYRVTLFSRRGKQIYLTALGEELFAITRRLATLESEAEQCLTDAKELRRGHLRLGADAPVHVMPLIAALESRHPGIDVSLSTGNSAELLHDIKTHRADVAVLANVAADPALTRVPIVHNQLTAFVHKSHPLGSRKRISPTELVEHRLVLRESGSMTRSIFDSALAATGVTADNLMEVDGREAVYAAVAMGLGVGIVAETELPTDENVVAVRISNLDLTTIEYLICLNERRHTRLIQTVFDIAQQTAGPASTTIN